jgi:hypothetical protein
MTTDSETTYACTILEGNAMIKDETVSTVATEIADQLERETYPSGTIIKIAARNLYDYVLDDLGPSDLLPENRDVRGMLLERVAMLVAKAMVLQCKHDTQIASE